MDGFRCWIIDWQQPRGRKIQNQGLRSQPKTNHKSRQTSKAATSRTTELGFALYTCA